MKKVKFECDICGFNRVVEMAESDEPQFTHMCDTGGVVVIDGVVEENPKHSDVCPLERTYKDEPDLYLLDNGEPV